MPKTILCVFVPTRYWGILLALMIIGCGTQPAPSGKAKASRDTKAEQAEALEKQIRGAMTTPEIMKLEYEGERAESGVRGMRQREAAKSLMLKLVALGEAAEDPLWRLVSDEDESVRRSCIMLLMIRSPFKDSEGKQVDPKPVFELCIPVLERALSSKDSQVRFYACGALGDFRDFSDDCLERLRLSLPKILDLKRDENASVRKVAWASCNMIYYALSNRGQTSEIRKLAAEELEKLGKFNNW